MDCRLSLPWEKLRATISTFPVFEAGLEDSCRTAKFVAFSGVYGIMVGSVYLLMLYNYYTPEHGLQDLNGTAFEEGGCWYGLFCSFPQEHSRRKRFWA